MNKTIYSKILTVIKNQSWRRNQVAIWLVPWWYGANITLGCFENDRTYGTQESFYSGKFWDIPQLLTGEIFRWKLAYLEPRVLQKNPQIRSIWPLPCSSHNSVYQGSHCSALLIGCVKFCSRLYSSPIDSTVEEKANAISLNF